MVHRLLLISSTISTHSDGCFRMVYSHSVALGNMVFVREEGPKIGCLPCCGESQCGAKSTQGQKGTARRGHLRSLEVPLGHISQGPMAHCQCRRQPYYPLNQWFPNFLQSRTPSDIQSPATYVFHVCNCRHAPSPRAHIQHITLETVKVSR